MHPPTHERPILMPHTHDEYEEFYEEEIQECPHCEGWPCICDRVYDLWADK